MDREKGTSWNLVSDERPTDSLKRSATKVFNSKSPSVRHFPTRRNLQMANLKSIVQSSNASGKNTDTQMDTIHETHMYLFGKFGNAYHAERKMNIPLPLESSVLQISCGGGWAAMILDNHHVYSWGDNSYGQLGDGSRVSKPIPTIIPALKDVEFSRVSCGKCHGGYVSTSGAVYTVGCGEYGRLGIKTRSPLLTPRALNILPNASPGAKIYRIANLIEADSTSERAKGTPWDKVVSKHKLKAANDTPPDAPATGTTVTLDAARDSKRSSRNNKFLPNNALEDDQMHVKVTDVSCGDRHTLFLCSVEFVPNKSKEKDRKNTIGQNFKLREGLVFSCGDGSNGRLGFGDDIDRYFPQQLTSFISKDSVEFQSPQFAVISAGEAHSSAITTTGILYTWGLGNDGRLGHGSADSVWVPTQVRGNGMMDNAHMKSVCCGTRHTIALDSKGRVYVWGRGTSGQIGNNKYEDSLLPVKLPSVIQKEKIYARVVAASKHHSAFLDENRRLYLWGENQHGQLGLANDFQICVPMSLQNFGHESQQAEKREKENSEEDDYRRNRMHAATSQAPDVKHIALGEGFTIVVVLESVKKQVKSYGLDIVADSVPDSNAHDISMDTINAAVKTKLKWNKRLNDMRSHALKSSKVERNEEPFTFQLEEELCEDQIPSSSDKYQNLLEALQQQSEQELRQQDKLAVNKCMPYTSRWREQHRDYVDIEDCSINKLVNPNGTAEPVPSNVSWSPTRSFRNHKEVKKKVKGIDTWLEKHHFNPPRAASASESTRSKRDGIAYSFNKSSRFTTEEANDPRSECAIQNSELQTALSANISSSKHGEKSGTSSAKWPSFGVSARFFDPQTTMNITMPGPGNYTPVLPNVARSFKIRERPISSTHGSSAKGKMDGRPQQKDHLMTTPNFSVVQPRPPSVRIVSSGDFSKLISRYLHGGQNVTPGPGAYSSTVQTIEETATRAKTKANKSPIKSTFTKRDPVRPKSIVNGSDLRTSRMQSLREKLGSRPESSRNVLSTGNQQDQDRATHS